MTTVITPLFLPARLSRSLDGNDVGQQSLAAAGHCLFRNYSLVQLGLKSTTEQAPAHCRPLVRGLRQHPTLVHLRYVFPAKHSLYDMLVPWNERWRRSSYDVFVPWNEKENRRSTGAQCKRKTNATHRPWLQQLGTRDLELKASTLTLHTNPDPNPNFNLKHNLKPNPIPNPHYNPNPNLVPNPNHPSYPSYPSHSSPRSSASSRATAWRLAAGLSSRR